MPSLDPAAKAEWLRLVEKTLAGRPFESLIARTDDGLAIRPLSPRAAGAHAVPGRAPGAPWTVVQRIDHPDPAAANAQAHEDLQNGATGLALVFRGAPAAHGFGITDLAGVLDGVRPDLTGLRIETAPYMGRVVAREMAALIEAAGLAPEKMDVAFGLDPLGDLASTGSLPATWNVIEGRLSEMVRTLGASGFRSPVLRADGRAWHAAGASEAQELAAVLATALAYLRALDAGGVAVEDGLRSIALMLAADCDQLLTTAKFRAARLLWARLAEEAGAAGVPARIDAETAWRDLTRRDPWTNLLRATVAVFSAGVAGADAITVLPFTQALGLPDGFARRLARNTQLILIEEANLHRIADPAAGAGAFEDLTESLAAKAWDLFRDIERQGGMPKALEAGHVQRAVAEMRAAREREIAGGRKPLIGTSVFPPPDEMPVSVLSPLSAPDETPAGNGSILAEPLRVCRLAELFEG